MYPLLYRILHKLSTDTLFTPFGLQMNKLGEEKKGKKVTSWRILKITLYNNFKSVLSEYIWILNSLIFPMIPKLPKTEFE